MVQFVEYMTECVNMDEQKKMMELRDILTEIEEKRDEYSRAMKSHFRKFGNQMSGSGNHLCNYAGLLA